MQAIVDPMHRETEAVASWGTVSAPAICEDGLSGVRKQRCFRRSPFTVLTKRSWRRGERNPAAESSRAITASDFPALCNCRMRVSSSWPWTVQQASPPESECHTL